MDEIRTLKARKNEIEGLEKAVKQYTELFILICKIECDMCDINEKCDNCCIKNEKDPPEYNCCTEYHNYTNAEVEFIKQVRVIIDTAQKAINNYKRRYPIRSKNK